eukprot:GHVT01056043.1.p1 GENE.GHVT01056043.1~~GHVT01056043.1.p1  ORF type:complete len:161 (+),score=6.72 GHVT01056043.1:362-844(+)
MDPDTKAACGKGTQVHGKRWTAKAVSSDDPPEKAGIYWGYKVTGPGSLKKAMSECPFGENGKYDLLIGTSEKGNHVDQTLKLPEFKNLLIVFGGVEGLEVVVNDSLSGFQSGVDPSSLFNLYYNTCADQKSRTIRTEEALPITLSLLRPAMLQALNRSAS